jgi:thioredoxin-related protein
MPWAALREDPLNQQPYIMKLRILRTTLLFCSLFALATWPERVQAADAPKSTRPNIYDEASDGAKQITDALVIAKKEHKHVLLQIGANWCVWCHRLHKLCESDKGIAEKLKNDFVVVMVDVNKEHNREVDKKYGDPTQFGLPVIVVLDADGKPLTTQDTGKLEEGDHHSPEKVMAFLKEWSPKK